MSTESSGFKTVYTETMPSKQACLECEFDIPAHEITGENGEKTGIFEIYDELSKSFARCKKYNNWQKWIPQNVMIAEFEKPIF